jgi:LysR family carnitine catabolism transcriptional activator
MQSPHRTLSISELEAVLLVAETLNFRRAAEQVHISQPALTRRVQAAEQKLGARLFDRSTHGVALTGAGIELVPIARRILSEFRDSLSDLSEFIAGRSGVVTIWALPSVAAALLPGAVSVFHSSHPKVRITIRTASALQVAEAVISANADLGITVAPPEDSPALQFDPLLTERFVMICSTDDPLARRKRVDWRVFRDRQFVASGPASSIRQVTDQVLAETGHPEAGFVVSDNISLVGALVAEGVGIAAVPQLALRLMDQTRLARVALHSPTATREIGVLTRRDRSLSAATRGFLSVLRQLPVEGRP